MAMIKVIASICVKSGSLSDYLAILKAMMPAVRNERGCIEYVAAVDIDAKLPMQVLEKKVVTILEKWESLEALHAHLGSPHMLKYREKVNTIVESVSVKILREIE